MAENTGSANQPSSDVPPIFVISGGTGSSGEHVVRTVLAQFPDVEVPVIVVPRVRDKGQLVEVVERAAQSGGTIVHTLVDGEMRQALIRLARRRKVVAIDLIGHLLTRLTQVLGREPLGQPGLYRRLREDYFERIEAIEFAVAHDDGRNVGDLPQAEIVLVGVSRVGKTPLSMYLSVLGWKVANIPVLKDVPLPKELFEVDPRRVVGLTIEPGQLVAYRRWRQQRLGIPVKTSYAAPTEIYEEVQSALTVLRRAGFPIVDMTDKPIEESAEEVIALVTRRTHSPK